ncbi:MAG: hypothetical protein V4537_15965 [Pseudomonadota bacterium]
MATARSKTVPPSASGYYRVSITRIFPDRGFDYRPGTAITVDRSTLDVMLAQAGLVDHVAAAD